MTSFSTDLLTSAVVRACTLGHAELRPGYRGSANLRSSKIGVLGASTGDSMSQFERLLVPGCTESPTCQCGEETDVATIEMLPEGQ
jgi:hypothetical protein